MTRILIPTILLAASCREAPPQGRPQDSGDTAEPDFLRRGDEMSRSLLEDGWPNLLLPTRVAVDADRRRAWVVSLTTPTLGEVDLDGGTLVAVHQLGNINQDELVPVIDEQGRVWLGNRVPPSMLRYDPASGEVDEIDTGLGEVYGMAPLAGGRMLVIGGDVDAFGRVVLDAEDAVEDQAVIDEIPSAVRPYADGTMVAMLTLGAEAPALSLLDAATFEETSRCELRASPTDFTIVGDDGQQTWAMVSNTEVWLTTCDGTDPSVVEAGRENRQVVDIGGSFVVLDRLGSDDLAGPNWGVARSYRLDLAEAARPVVTGKHSAFGALDPVEGRIWMNSEGTTELWSLDTQTDAVVETVRLGVHLETAIADPAVQGRVYATGRLSNTLARIDFAPDGTSELTTLTDAMIWPGSPVWGDGRLWVANAMESKLVELDLDTLEPIAEFDPGIGSNSTLTLSDLAWHPTRHTLWFAHGQANELVEVDPDTGSRLATWMLGGEPIANPQAPGRLEVLTSDSAVFTVRTTDGVLTRIDPDLPTPTHSDVFTPGDGGVELQLGWLSPDQDRLYVGGSAYDPSDLTRIDSENHSVDLVVGERSDGGLVGYRAETATLVVLDALDQTVDSWPVSSAWGEPTFAWVGEWNDAVLYADFGAAAAVLLGVSSKSVP